MTEKLLSYIRDFIDQHGYAPSYREMASGVGVHSTRTISRYLDQLRRDGKVDWTPSQRRTLRLIGEADGNTVGIQH